MLRSLSTACEHEILVILGLPAPLLLGGLFNLLSDSMYVCGVGSFINQLQIQPKACSLLQDSPPPPFCFLHNKHHIQKQIMISLGWAEKNIYQQM